MEHKRLADVETAEPIPGVTLAQLVGGAEMSIQHFAIEPDAEIPQHQHHHEQSGFIYEGELTLKFEGGKEVIVGSGDSYVMEANESHGAANEGDRIVRGVDIFSPPRLNPDWAE